VASEAAGFWTIFYFFSAPIFTYYFIKSKKEADQYHIKIGKIRKDIRDLEKIIKALKAKQAKSKEEREREELIKKARKIYEMFKKGEKLETEDILLLQRAGLI